MKKVILIIFLLLINLNVVKAITLDEIKEEINNRYINMEASTKEDGLIINSNKQILKFNFNNNVLTRSNSYLKNSLDSVNDLYVYLNLTKVIALLKGYPFKDVEYFLVGFNKATMNENGYEVIKEKDNDKIKLTYKIDLDKFKINCQYIEALKPEIIIDNIKDNEIKLYIKLDENQEIDLYRSTDKEHYEYLTSLPVIDGVSIYYIDDDLDKDKTYYYKATVKMANNYSEVATVDFPKEEIDNNYLDEEVENPLTGYQEFVAISMLIIIAIIGIISNINLRKKVFR